MWSVSDLYDSSVITLKTSDTVLVARELLQDQNVSYLPILQDCKILKNVSLEDLDLLDEEDTLSALESQSINTSYFVNVNAHYFEGLLAINSIAHLSSVAVVDDELNFKGILKLKDMLSHYIPPNSVYNESSWVVLVMPNYDYSLTKIADIVEYNRCKVLQVLTKNDNEHNTWVQILINSKTVTSSVKSFERFGYQVAYVSSPGETEDYDGRYQSLIKYLDL